MCNVLLLEQICGLLGQTDLTIALFTPPVSVLDSFFSTARGLASYMSRLEQQTQSWTEKGPRCYITSCSCRDRWCLYTPLPVGIRSVFTNVQIGYCNSEAFSFYSDTHWFKGSQKLHPLPVASLWRNETGNKLMKLTVDHLALMCSLWKSLLFVRPLKTTWEDKMTLIPSASLTSLLSLCRHIICILIWVWVCGCLCVWVVLPLQRQSLGSIHPLLLT